MAATPTTTPNTSQEILAAIANLAAGATTIATKTHAIATPATTTAHRGVNALATATHETATPTAAGTRESAMTVTIVDHKTTIAGLQPP